ncbi:unnamed protein product [Pylaiella littoralis]
MPPPTSKAGGGAVHQSGSPTWNKGGSAGGAMVLTPSPDRNALNGMGEFILTQVRRGASEQQWSDWLKVPFEHACLARDMSTVRRLLEAGVNGPYDRPRDPRWRRHTLLHLSAACGNSEVMNMLLRWGSSPDVACREPGEKGYTPLHRAALGGHGEAARVLIKAGADKDLKTGGSGASALHLAARKGHESCVRTLILTGADKDSRRSLDGATPLHQAAFFGQVGAARELLDSVANPNSQDDEGCTPVFLAAQEGHEEVVIDLLRNEAAPDLSREDGWAPLHAAARFGHASTAAALLEEGGADLDAVTGDHGSTALHVAAISGFDEVLVVLLDAGSDMERADSGGWTPLHCACAAARVSCVNALIARGADPTAMTPEGQRPSTLIGTDLAEGEEPNSETNERIWTMLKVPRAETDARRRRRTAKKAGNNVRPPPPYNDRPPPAYEPGSVGGAGIVFDSAGSGSATGSASGSFSGSGSRQLHRSPKAPPGSGGKGARRGAPHFDGTQQQQHPDHHERDANGGGGYPRDNMANPRGRSSGDPPQQQHQQRRRPREPEGVDVRAERELLPAGEGEDGDEGGDEVPGLVGYNPATERPSSRNQRFSTGGVVGSGFSPSRLAAAAAGLSAARGGGGGGGGAGKSSLSTPTPGPRGVGKTPSPGAGVGAEGEAKRGGSSRSRSPVGSAGSARKLQQERPRGGGGGVVSPRRGGGGGGKGEEALADDAEAEAEAAAAVAAARLKRRAGGGGGKSDDGDVVMELDGSSPGAVGVRRREGGGGGSANVSPASRLKGRRAGDDHAHGGGGGGDGNGSGDASPLGKLLGRPFLTTDNRRSSAGRASGGPVFHSNDDRDDGDHGGLSRTGERGGGAAGGGRVGGGRVAAAAAAYDPFSYTQQDALGARGTPKNAK